MDARTDADYMAWWNKNGTMHNPDMEYDAWCAGKAFASRSTEPEIRHLPSCGTLYRGCSPDCPKRLSEKLGVYL